MTNPDHASLRNIKRLYGGIVVTVGALMGFVLCIFAFTLGIMIDGGHTAFLVAEAPATAVIVAGLIYLKPLSLKITKLLSSGNADRRHLLKNMTVADLEKLTP